MESEKYTKYRYIIELLWLITMLVQSLSWQSISPLLDNILKDLHITYGQGGALLTVVQVIGGISMFLGTKIIEIINIKKTTLLALLMFFIGNLMTYLSFNYPFLIVARLFIGLGFGLFVAIAGTQTMIWFPKKERAIVNTLNSMFSIFGYAISFFITVPILNIVGDWKKVFLIYALYALIMFFIHCFISKEVKIKKSNSKNSIKQAFSYPQVKNLILAKTGILWAYNVFTTYFPSYLKKYYDISSSTASSITGMIPLLGACGALFTGILLTYFNKRKIFMFFSITFVIIGIIGSIYANNYFLWIIFTGLIGIGFSSFTPIYQTILMELPNATPSIVSGGVAWITGTNNILAFFITFIFDYINTIFNMKIAFLSFSAFALLSLVFILNINN